jgi:hypothetical protein
MPTSEQGVYDVAIDPVTPGRDDKYDADSSCWINWRIAFKYSPAYHRTSGKKGSSYCQDAKALSAKPMSSLPQAWFLQQ